MLADQMLQDFSPSTELDGFYINTVKRLLIAGRRMKNDRKYTDDFLIAFRDYLLVFDTGTHLPQLLVPEDNPYGIYSSEGQYYSSFSHPSGVTTSFVEHAFMRGIQEPKSSKTRNLVTDPYIYRLTGFTHFKSWAQKLAVYGALNTPAGYTTLVSMPTGSGKSLVTQTLAFQAEGLTIVVVPTVSLAIDQVRAAKENVKCADPENEIVFYRSGTIIGPILKAISNKKARLLFISPEALINNLAFASAIEAANKQKYLRNIVIDEAHIVIDWGASFRVDYQFLEPWRKHLLNNNHALRTFLLSATFEDYCVSLLKSMFSDDSRWIKIRCDALRHEPMFMMLNEKSEMRKRSKAIELIRKLPHPMIVYVSRPDEAEAIKDELNKNGIRNVHTFTGHTNNDDREALIRLWADNDFEIMIATSAFGVGVDKGDVRTVLHLYIPENPNAFYQELGRGGRDTLPCLSVVCINVNSDYEVSRSRLAKKVLTTEKILGRWDSLYNNPKSIRIGNRIFIDTSIRPNYNASDELDDVPISDADMNWNVYVLLLLRRHSMIQFFDIAKVGSACRIEIEISNSILHKTGSDELRHYMENVRAIEWDYYNKAHNQLERALKHCRSMCWSEMFYDTYSKVDEYCPGCYCHKSIYNGESGGETLKQAIREPVYIVSPEQELFFTSEREATIYVSDSTITSAIRAMMKKQLAVWITDNTDFALQCLNDIVSNSRQLLIIDFDQMIELAQRRNWYFLSGAIAVLYSDDNEKACEQFRLIRKYLTPNINIRILHLLLHNIEFHSIGKTAADLIKGPIVTAQPISS